jgi:CheY-like chemotaxis protein
MRHVGSGLPGHIRSELDKGAQRPWRPVIPPKNNTAGMVQRIFIKVVGFSEEERHALNTVFRLSEQCRTAYQLWTPEAPQAPRVALLDANSHEARVEAAATLDPDLRILWAGADPPPGAWRAFARPLAWPDVIESLDALFAPDDGLDLDLGLAEDSVMSQKHALIVSSDRDRRLYLRARLSLAKLTFADEADSGVQAVELARGKQYDVALVDGTLSDMDALALLRQLRQGQHPVPHLAMTKAGLSMAGKVRARFAGADALLEHPPQPAQLKAWLSRI